MQELTQSDDQKGLILLDPIRTVDPLRLVEKLGAVSAKTTVTMPATAQQIFAE